MEGQQTAVAPEAPATEAPAAPQQAQPEAPAKPMSRREAKMAARDAQRQKEASQPRDPNTGQFAGSADDGGAQEPVAEAPVEEAEVEPTAEATETATDAPEESREPEARQEEPAGEQPRQEDTWITVELEEGHPLRETQGRKDIRVHPDDADLVRAMNNGTYHRRKEVEELEAKLLELQKAEVRQKSQRTAMQKLEKSPEYNQAVEDYKEIKDIRGPEAAKRFWDSMQSKFQSVVDQEFETNWSQVEQERVDKAAERWTQDALRQTSRLPEGVRANPEFNGDFQRAVVGFNAELEAGMHPEVQDEMSMHREFSRYLMGRLLSSPHYRTAFMEARQANQPKEPQKPPMDPEQIKKQAVEEYKRQVAQQRQQTPPHPMGRVGQGTATGAASSQEPQDLSNVTGRGRLRRAAKEQARQLSASRFT